MQWPADVAAHDERELDAAERITTGFGGLLARTRHLRIAAGPYEVTDVDAPQVGTGLPEPQTPATVAEGLDAEDRAARLVLVRRAVVKDDSQSRARVEHRLRSHWLLARLEPARCAECQPPRHGTLRRIVHDRDFVALDPRHAPERQPTMAREPAFDERLMIDATEEARRAAAAVRGDERRPIVGDRDR